MNHVRPHHMAAAIVALFLSGCQLGSPFVRIVRPPCTVDCPLPTAIGYSQQVRATYRDRLHQHAQLRSGTGAAAIALGAAALGFTAGGAHRDAFTALGLLGATSYGYASWYGNPPREALFLQTIEALVCAEGAAVKLHLPDPVSVRLAALETLLETNLRALSAKLAELEKFDDALKTYAEGHQNSSDTTEQQQAAQANEEAAVNEAIEARSEAAQRSASAAQTAIAQRRAISSSAGTRLVVAVDRIVAATDREALKTLPDPDAALQLIAGLGGIASRIAPIPEVPEASASALAGGAPPGAAAFVSAAAVSVADLNSVRSTIAQIIDRITQHVDQAQALVGNSELTSFATLDGCSIAGLSELAAIPAELTVKYGTEATTSIEVTGAKPPVWAEFVGTVPSGVQLVNPGIAGGRIVVVVNAAPSKGTFTLRIRDGSGRAVSANLEVVE